MNSIRKSQFFLILGGILLIVLLYMAPRSMGEESLEELATVEHDHDHEESTDELPKDDEQILALTDRLASAEDLDLKLSILDSLALRSIELNDPPSVGYYTAQKAMLDPSIARWLESGDNYFRAFRLSRNSSLEMLENTMDAYRKVLEIDANNLKAQTSLGVCYVEGAQLLNEPPMTGIGMLLKVLQQDPENVDALLNLGYFSIQSGQFDKAIERFEKVLSIEPENANAYLYLTDVYLQQEDSEKAIEQLERYKTLVKDTLVGMQVDQYIEDIRSNNSIQ